MKFRIGLCQTKGSNLEDINENKKETWNMAEMAVRKCTDEGCDIIALPEMWNTPYANSFFSDYSEDEKGITVERMSKLAEELSVYLIGGSISERSGDKIYNTCFVFDREGNIIGKHRKVHLFDVDVKGAIRFMESDTLSAGDEITVVDTEFGKIGIAICFDVRFPEMFVSMRNKGADLVVLPAAFSRKTGESHWDILMRTRAVDNQIYLAAVSPARTEGGIYEPYGHSMVVDPWGDIIRSAGTDEEVIVADIDNEYMESVRSQLPLAEARRPEIYK